MLATFNERDLQNDLWQVVLNSLGSLQIGPICAYSLRAWIATAVGRMRSENRLTAQDLAIARTNLARLVDIMKAEGFILGRADRLDIEAFHATHRNVERHAILTSWNLWPFWPKEFLENN
jgi:hypothetical protein